MCEADLKLTFFLLFLSLCADTGPKPEMLDPPWAHPTCHRTQLRHRKDNAKHIVQGSSQAAFHLCKSAKVFASQFCLAVT